MGLLFIMFTVFIASTLPPYKLNHIQDIFYLYICSENWVSWKTLHVETVQNYKNNT